MGQSVTPEVLQVQLLDAIEHDPEANKMVWNKAAERKLEALIAELYEFDPSLDRSLMFWIIHQYAQKDFTIKDKYAVRAVLDRFYSEHVNLSNEERRDMLIQLKYDDLRELSSQN